MYCTWFAHKCAHATWAYVLETVCGTVRRFLKISNCAFQCDYYYPYHHQYYYYYCCCYYKWRENSQCRQHQSLSVTVMESAAFQHPWHFLHHFWKQKRIFVCVLRLSTGESKDFGSSFPNRQEHSGALKSLTGGEAALWLFYLQRQSHVPLCCCSNETLLQLSWKHVSLHPKPLRTGTVQISGLLTKCILQLKWVLVQQWQFKRQVQLKKNSEKMAIVTVARL